MNLAQRLARYAAGLRYENLPPEAIHEAKRRLLDSLGCAMGALHSEPATIARTLARTVTAAEIPLGVLTAIVGAPVFALLLRRHYRDRSAR